ncbi:16S rRNA (cytidine1402-2'-O)-methyltransferase [Capnocytophaga haemolytica]|uniref:Ribosomal RNA small subunit methyltransferase I n=1 Tax=Capnocytophaga haemolytica TaxID=45243 RepID=A0AAX2H156_9FLAO|nr:SAM-dependent methyltransferase [Capnocytophaga haemolytica]AMD85634.1 SAM-dependent methyltransferase [Capnocytophaga haemolytica]SFN89373.1 16S rRNA (cytidine1402-2'-O)-methyltransferase [Capnocytophaga haemolytica]SNV16672.1 Ribosomal RNA small subunit methyltransferase I [Capnocytophaga haemolytica]
MANVYLIPCTLGDSSLEVLSPQIKATILSLSYFIVENEKSARRFIKQVAPEKEQSTLHIAVIDKHNAAADVSTLLQPCSEEHSVGIISEAGCPGVADPGAEVVRLAHQRGLRVIPLVGPSSILLALMASGMSGQHFAFNGYLPIDKSERKRTFKALERKAHEGQTQVCIETPYRNEKLLTDMLGTLQPSTLVCVALDITLPTEEIYTLPVSQWRKKALNLQKRPAIFIIGK